jgi:hypothetical protein
MRDVLTHFLRAEMTRPTYVARCEEMNAWMALDDEKFLQHVRELSAGRSDVNPVLTWTVGTRENKHHQRVDHWLLAKVPLRSLYSCGINQTVEDDLNAGQGNLFKFADVASKYPEFRTNSVPQGELATIIGVAHPCAGKVGSVEVLDGVHRAVAMVKKGIAETHAFLAKLRSEG